MPAVPKLAIKPTPPPSPSTPTPLPRPTLPQPVAKSTLPSLPPAFSPRDAPTSRPKLVIPDTVDRAIPEDILPQDGVGEGRKQAKVAQKDVTGSHLLIKMGQANSKGIVSKRDVIKFENHIRHDFIISKHPVIIQGPNRLKYLRVDGRCGPEFLEVAVSDFIQTYEQWLPLNEFDNCECTRYLWISAFLIKQASAIRSAAAGTLKEGAGKGKRKREGKDSDGSVKRAKRFFTVRVLGSVAVNAYRCCSGLQNFGALVKWVDSQAKPTGRRIRLHVRYKCTLEGEQAEEIGVVPGQVFEGELFDQDSWDSQVENFCQVTPTSNVLLIEVRIVGEEEEEGAEESVIDLGAAETVSFVDAIDITRRATG